MVEVAATGKRSMDELKSELSRLYKEKEEWFGKKRELSSQITQHINQIKDHRTQRDNLTKFVQEAKEKRKVLNQTIRQKIEVIKAMYAQKSKLPTQTSDDGKKTSVNPEMLLKDIKKLQYRIETEGMNFESEQKVMKLIKEKQSQYEESKGSVDLFKNLRSLSKEIDALKKESDTIHEEIQQKALDSQKFHESMLVTSKLIDELKEQEKEATEKFTALKNQYGDISKQLREVLAESGASRPQPRARSEAKEKPDEEYEHKRKKLLKEHEQRVKEKMAKGEMLTTEDLYIIQNMADDEEEIESKD